MLPVILTGSQWIIEVALTLTDESQQFGNIEETSVIARTSRTCLNVWAGDHRRTPGGLKNTCENHARKMRTFFTRRLEPKTKSSNAFKWSLRPKRK